MTKTCTKCGEEKDAGEFSPDKRKKDGLYGRCRICRREDYRIHYEANLEESRERGRDWAKENRKSALAAVDRWRKKNPYKVRLQMSRNAAKKRGHMPCTATAEELEMAFDGKCRICGVPEMEMNQKLNLDHDHETGEFRGWLCGKCNKALGLFNDSEEVLIDALHYLMAFQS